MVFEGASYGRPPHGAFIFRGRMWCHTRVQELRYLHKGKSWAVLGVKWAELGQVEGLFVNTLR